MIAITKRTRRTESQLIADIEARIAALKARAAEKQAPKNPALRHVKAAVRSVDKAAGQTKDQATRTALGEARSTLVACLELSGVLVPAGRGGARVRRGIAVDEAALLAHIRVHPNQRAEQISVSLGTDSTTMRPVMKRLIEAGKVRTKGEKRATTYAAA